MKNLRLTKIFSRKIVITILLCIIAVFLLLKIIGFFLVLSLSGINDPILFLKYMRELDKSLASESWITHTDSQVGLSFEVPPVYSSRFITRSMSPSVLSKCTGGRIALGRLSFCKNPTEEYIINWILNDHRSAGHKQLTLNNKNYTVVGLSNNWDIGSYWISDDHKLLIEFMLPYASETPRWERTRLEKIFTRIISTAKLL